MKWCWFCSRSVHWKAPVLRRAMISLVDSSCKPHANLSGEGLKVSQRRQRCGKCFMFFRCFWMCLVGKNPAQKAGSKISTVFRTRHGSLEECNDFVTDFATKVSLVSKRLSFEQYCWLLAVFSTQPQYEGVWRIYASVPSTRVYPICPVPLSAPSVQAIPSPTSEWTGGVAKSNGTVPSTYCGCRMPKRTQSTSKGAVNPMECSGPKPQKQNMAKQCKAPAKGGTKPASHLSLCSPILFTQRLFTQKPFLHILFTQKLFLHIFSPIYFSPRDSSPRNSSYKYFSPTYFHP